MKLIERSEYLKLLRQQFEKVTAGDGHTLFVSGEAGIGKTSLINVFCKQQENGCLLFQGACDSLFTPRPLAPLFDIAWQIGNGLPAVGDSTENTGDRATLFSRVLHELSN
jgi:predicted ATPase